MKELLRSNIKKSLKVIYKENPEIPSSLIKIIEEDSNIPKRFSLVESLVKSAVRPIPLFYRVEPSELRSPQESFFGFYALRNMLRGIFLSVQFIKAGDLLRKNNFFAASIISYYTASFHLLLSFLASCGIVIVEQIQGCPVKIIKRKNSSEGSFSSLGFNSKIIVARLKKNSSWKFETKSRTHTARWKELGSVVIGLGDKTPKFFNTFFKYILSYGPHPSDNSETFIQDGIKRLTNIRHESIYSGYGYDDYVFDGLSNKDIDTSYGIDLKSKSYRDFTFGFLSHVVNDVKEIKPHLSEGWAGLVQSTMAVSVITPPFQLDDLKLEDCLDISEQLESIYNWLLSK